jgi:hypothetical protein
MKCEHSKEKNIEESGVGGGGYTHVNWKDN